MTPLDLEFDLLAAKIVATNQANLLNDGPEEQIARAVERLHTFAKHTHLEPVHDQVIDLAGFGEATVYFRNEETSYVLLSEVAEQLGMTAAKANAWARQEWLYTVENQREVDEERGDGRLGYELMGLYCDLRLSFVVDDPDANPDRDGRRWSFGGDWLISHDRLFALICASPWSKEFLDNASDAMAIGMRRHLGDKLDNLTAYDRDGNPLPGVELFSTDLTEEEAIRKARRGPAGALGDDQ
jgi:hypothetical protein